MTEISTAIKIMLVDDHSLVRDGIKSLIEDEADLHVIDEANSGEEGLRKALTNTDVDIMIVDIRMPGMSGIDMVSELSKQNLDKRYLMLSMHDSEEYVIQSLQAGAHGYLLKDASKEEFIKAIKTIHQGDVYFSGDISKYLLRAYTSSSSNSLQRSETSKSNVDITKKEYAILQLVAKGMSNQEIADNLGNSKRTIESHRFNLMKKMDVKNQVELLNKSRDLGILN